MNVYQQVIQYLSTHAPLAIPYASQNAYELQELYNTGSTIEDLAKICIDSIN